MKVDRLGPVYVKGVLEFLEIAEQNLPKNNGLFYCPCVNCRNIKKVQRKKCYIAYVVMEYVNVIQYEHGMEKWIKLEM